MFAVSSAQTDGEKLSTNSSEINNIQFDEDKIKRQIESLNQRTPINLVYNKTVGQHIQFYLTKRPEQVAKLLALSEYYFPVFEEILDKNEVPLELKYLPIIESSLNPHARSSAGAVGLWQFMYLTAKEYGLRINSYLDERKDINKSTEAACRYLKRAYSKFNSWSLALSAYNAGERNVKKAIRRSGGKSNYWELRPFLPKETRNYVPSFIAAVYVMNFASEYGIRLDTNHLFKEIPVDSVYLRRGAKIEHLADLLDINSNTIKKLNPVYRTKFIPFLEEEKFAIILPQNKADQFVAQEDSIYVMLNAMELAEKAEYPEYTDIEKIRYTVKKGDYLGKIAAKYKCTVKDIMLWNDLKTHKIYQGKKLNIYKTVK